MRTSCAPLIADLLCFAMEETLWPLFLGIKKLKLFRQLTLYLHNLLNIDNPYFEGMVGRSYPHELQLNKANMSDIKASFLMAVNLFLTDLFHPKFMISALTLILTQ